MRLRVAACAAVVLALAGCGSATKGSGAGTATATKPRPTVATPTSPAVGAGSTSTTTRGSSPSAPIVVDAPAGFDVVVGSFDLAGSADVFEGTVQWELDNNSSAPLQQGTVQASCGTGCRGTFHQHVVLSPKVRPGNYTLVVFDVSPQTGAHQHQVPVPLTVHAHAG